MVDVSRARLPLRMSLPEAAAVDDGASCLVCEGMLTLFALGAVTIREGRFVGSFDDDAGSASIELSADSIVIWSPVNVLDRAMVLG